mmetsp:Transcript_52910/g.147351  ORF Transcript_52910/g.147351 Transcript_52910/m.147351 type:complete len:84 (-) Transcript_52910:4-255(-)
MTPRSPRQERRTPAGSGNIKAVSKLVHEELEGIIHSTQAEERRNAMPRRKPCMHKAPVGRLQSTPVSKTKGASLELPITIRRL